MKSAAAKVAGAAVLDAARAALAPFAELHIQVTSIPNSNSASARHRPIQNSPTAPQSPLSHQSSLFQSPINSRKRLFALTYAENSAHHIDKTINSSLPNPAPIARTAEHPHYSMLLIEGVSPLSVCSSLVSNRLPYYPLWQSRVAYSPMPIIVVVLF